MKRDQPSTPSGRATAAQKRIRMTAVQREWCKNYEQQTTFEPLMDDFLYGVESFAEAARKSIRWFEDWSSDAYLAVSHLPEEE